MAAEGVVFRPNTWVGKDLAAKELLVGYDALCVSIGSGIPRDLQVEGRGLKGICFALDMLKQQNRVLAGEEIPAGKRISAWGKKVLVIGGGDTGSDCVGTSIRQGAVKVTQIEIMPQPPVGQNPETPWPAYPNVLKTSSSHEEGCTRRWNLDTVRFIGSDGRVAGAEVERVEWEKGGDGRWNMTRTGEKEMIEADLVLLCMGFVHPDGDDVVKELSLEVDSRRNILIGGNSECSVGRVFAAGDAARGASLVVRAIASGCEAAENIDRMFS